MNRHYVEFRVAMYHIEDISDEGLEALRVKVEEAVKKVYPCTMLDGDVEVEIQCHSFQEELKG